MRWVRRVGRPTPVDAAPEADPGPVERASPGLAALLERVSEDRSHAVLDLGPAAGASLRVYGRYARWVRFADVLDAATSPATWPEALTSLCPNPERPFDLVFAWDILDRLLPEDRPGLVQRLAAISAPEARLFVVLESPDERSIDFLRFTVAGSERIRYASTGEVRPPYPPVAPAEVKQLLEPFRVQHAFTTQVGLREYVGVRRGGYRQT